MNQDVALTTLERALAESNADQTEAVLLAEERALTRFADNEIHQNIFRSDHQILIRVVLGEKIGLATANTLTEESIEKTIHTAITVAQLLPDDTDFVSLPQNIPHREIKGYSSTLLTPRKRAEIVQRMVRRCESQGLMASGAVSTGAEVTAIANSLGIRKYFRESTVMASLSAHSGEGSGWAQEVGRDTSWINLDELTNRAIVKANLSRSPAKIEPGEFSVILEAPAVATLILFLSFLGFGGKALLEGRSFMRGKLGEKIAGENITIVDDALNPRMDGSPFDAEGVPKQRVSLVERGIAKGVVYDSYHAHLAGTESTGHALPADNSYGPHPKNLILAGGNSSIEEMIASTDRGILVTRFWYTNFLNPMRTEITGTTRDGTFLVERGRIRSAIQPLRFAQSILEALNHVEALSEDLMLCHQHGASLLVPAAKIGRFRFVSSE